MRNTRRALWPKTSEFNCSLKICSCENSFLPFHSGATDTFEFSSKHVGEIAGICIGHITKDGKKAKSDYFWHVMEVVVTEEELGNKWVKKSQLSYINCIDAIDVTGVYTYSAFLPLPSCLGISSTVMHRLPWQPKKINSRHLSAISPLRASRAKSATWSLSSMRSSSSLETSKEQAQMPMFSLPCMASMVTRASALYGKSSATCLNEGARIALFWRCWTSGSCCGSKWSMTALAQALGGIWSVLKWPTLPPQWLPSSCAENGWTLIGPTSRFSECSTPDIRGANNAWMYSPPKTFLSMFFMECFVRFTRKMKWMQLHLRLQMYKAIFGH